jgi:Ca2+-binding RTX toxin-like protein
MCVDVTAGGDVLVEGNTITQPANSDNPNIVWYATRRGTVGAGRVILRNNKIINRYDGGTLAGVQLQDQPEVTVVLKGNTIVDPSGELELATGRYRSKANTLNGRPLPEGEFDSDWPILARRLPEALAAAPQPAMERSWPGGQGVYRLAGWGNHQLDGTPGRDVLKAKGKGRKVLRGFAGDDVYLPWGQAEVVEKAGEGTDWIVVRDGGWAYRLPDHVEGFVMHGNRPYQKGVDGNGADNVLIGAAAGGNQLRGNEGDDVIYGGGAGGNRYDGGPGEDVVVLPGKRSEYTVKQGGLQVVVAYPDGATDTLANVEILRFTDEDMRLAD